jgi:chromosome segregation protein
MPHFLKRIELNGFKSFAGKTVMEFPAGIVAIVGPNGSGKSNIVDAIRWLLGERDAKNLRGGKTEDLIFAGTQKRPRVGLAQASLHFENSNNFFPVDFEEVTVTREVRRDGESKYFLNKSEILLRDLIDFFAKARLGSRGLIVIGQGESDMFIRATPIERREMIEEILGLREYQIKKADAARRLKNSRINLDKARALIEEILPHLRSLKRQTGRWEKREMMETELRGLENLFFGCRLRELSGKYKAVETIIAENAKQRAVFEKELREAEAREADVEASQPEEKKDLMAVKEQTRQALEKQNALQKDLGRLEAHIEMAHASVSKKSGAPPPDVLLELIQKIRQELEVAVNEDMPELQAAVEAIIEEIDFALDRPNSSGKNLGWLEEEEKEEKKPAMVSDGLKPQLAAVMKELHGLEEALASLRAKEASLQKSQEAFYGAFKAAMADVQAAKNKLDAWEKKNREHTLEKERLDLMHDEIVRQIEQAGRRADEFSDDMPAEAIASSELPETERRIFRLRGELAGIGDVDAALVKEASDTEARYQFLKKESEDLEKAVVDLTRLMRDLSEKIRTEFDASLYKINDAFNEFFGVMFDGGSAKLKVLKPEVPKIKGEEGDGEESEPENDGAGEGEEEKTPETDGGIAIEVKLPRKKATSLDMLSGGERSLIGIAALFAMISVSPPPFLVLDEIDAALDERNARRFSEMVKDFSKRTQFIIVTHNRTTMEAAEILYGVTLAEDGTSKIVSMKLEPAA